MFNNIVYDVGDMYKEGPKPQRSDLVPGPGL